RYTSWEPHRSIEESRAFLRQVLAAYATGRTGTWGIVDRASGRVVGTVTLFNVDQGDRRAEIGYALARPLWGRGYMTEAVRAVLAFGFEALGLNRIEAMCEAPNVASARVMEKVGMRYEGTLRQYLFSKGAFQDMRLYAILREEWPGATG
ncbi:MAG: GNAT family N-acetyltransferase, partial [Thermomicrobiaceae bacterium]|nr:GNAT family N-acetyltransferase [Thermomicrobiaceae bacterium]